MGKKWPNHSLTQQAYILRKKHGWSDEEIMKHFISEGKIIAQKSDMVNNTNTSTQTPHPKAGGVVPAISADIMSGPLSLEKIKYIVGKRIEFLGVESDNELIKIALQVVDKEYKYASQIKSDALDSIEEEELNMEAFLEHGQQIITSTAPQIEDSVR